MRVWNSKAKEWLEVMSITFGPDNKIVHIHAKVPGTTTMADGWFDIHNDDLRLVAIGEFVCLNPELLPDPDGEKEPVE